MSTIVKRCISIIELGTSQLFFNHLGRGNMTERMNSTHRRKVEKSKRTSYQNLVFDQLSHFIEVLGDCEPLVAFASQLEGCIEVGIPLWWLSLSEKPVPLGEDDRDILSLNDRDLMDALNVPEQYEWIRVEREMVINSEGKETLVERVYFWAPNGERDLGIVSVLYQLDRVADNRLTILSTHDMRDKRKASFAAVEHLQMDSPRSLLKINRPIVTSY